MCQIGQGHGHGPGQGHGHHGHHGQGHGHGHGHGHGQGHGCCTPGGRHGHHGCCCCGGAQPGCCSDRGWRRFVSPAEERERLQHYLAELKNEMAGVEARLRELKE